MIDAIYRRLTDPDFALEEQEVVMLLVALINILAHNNRADSPTDVLLMAAYGEQGVLDRPNMRVTRWINEALLSGLERAWIRMFQDLPTSCATKKGDSRGRSSDECNDARSERDDAKTGEDKKKPRSSH